VQTALAHRVAIGCGEHALRVGGRHL
jgi:hypothetical protein